MCQALNSHYFKTLLGKRKKMGLWVDTWFVCQLLHDGVGSESKSV